MEMLKARAESTLETLIGEKELEVSELEFWMFKSGNLIEDQRIYYRAKDQRLKLERRVLQM